MHEARLNNICFANIYSSKADYGDIAGTYEYIKRLKCSGLLINDLKMSA